MNVARRNDIFKELENYLDRFSTWPAANENSEITSPEWNPRVDIKEDDNAYMLRAELPGLQKKDINVTLEQGLLTVRGEKKFEKTTTNEKVHRNECYYGSFIRSFRLPENVEDNKVSASYKDGILNLTVPKSANTKPKQIEVEVK